MRIFSLCSLLLAATPALAAPGYVPLQGLLADSSGAAIDGQVQVSFTLFDDVDGTTSLWTDTLTLDVVDGRFAATLGAGTVPLDLSTFASFPTAHLQIQVSGDDPMPMVPLDAVPYAAWADHAGDAATLGGATLGDLRAEIPATTDLAQAARDAAYDTPAELVAALDGTYLPASYAPDWTAITNRPAGLDDGDDVRSQAEVEAWAQGVCLDSEDELTALLDNNYKAYGWVPAWTDVTGRPAGLDDGDDVRSQAEVEAWARGVAFDTKAELTTELAGEYRPNSWVPAWSDITGRPAGLDDGDNDTQLSESQVDAYVANNGYAAQSSLATVATSGSYGDLANLPDQTHYFYGSFATQSAWHADVVFTGNYARFCEAMGKEYVDAETLSAHYASNRSNGFFYAGWYYVGPRYCGDDTHVYGSGIPTDAYNVWQYSGTCGCCIENGQWTFERSAMITCR